MNNNYKYIRIRSPDTDVFFILLHHACELERVTVLFDTGTGNKQRLIDVSGLAQKFTQNKCTALMSLHAFTGCDSSSAFKNLGKVKPMKLVLSVSSYDAALGQLGESWDVSDNLIDDLDHFTCALYGRPQIKKVNDL